MSLEGFFVVKDESMKQIALTQGKFAIVDDDDYGESMKHKWYASKKHYGGYVAKRNTLIGGKKTHSVYMHREIMGLKRGDRKQVDHINHKTLDNRRQNLRLCTNQQNQMNRGPDRKNISSFKGVSWDRDNKKWRAQLGFNGRNKHLGRYASPIEAAKAYDKAAIKYFGEFAHLNFPVAEVGV